MQSFRDGFDRTIITKDKERPIPRSFKDGFARPIAISKNNILSIPFDVLFFADKVSGKNGESIPIWPDIKGGYDAPSATATDAVLTKNVVGLNGHAAITFNGTQAFQNTTYSTGQPRTVIVVWNTTVGSRNHNVIDGAYINNQSGLMYRNASSGYRVVGDQSHYFDYVISRPSDYVINIIDFNGASSEIFQNGVSLRTGNLGTAEMHGITLGASYSLDTTYATVGNIALAGIVEGGLDSAGKTRTWSILSRYYGIALS
jgi:hypothetical protein